MKITKLLVLIGGITAILISQACNRFLEEKSDYSLSTPESLMDLRALLDNESIINQNYPGLTEVGVTEYYLGDAGLGNIALNLQDAYLWDMNELATDLSSWSKPYEAVMVANVVLENISTVPNVDHTLYKQVLGEAHFVRAAYLFYLSQIFCLPYDENNAETLLGIPLKYSSNLSEKIDRSSLQQTYEQIIADLYIAKDNLPEKSSYKTRATKCAAMAMLSRVYLTMASYDNAEKMADSALLINSALIDYNSLDAQIAYPFKPEYSEVIYSANSPLTSTILLSNETFVSDEFYKTFDNNDLRKTLFFTENTDGKITFRGYYTGFRTSYFAGLAVDELYLNKAECLARRGQFDAALELLGRLRVKRYRIGSYENLADNDGDVLDIVLEERRKQLFRRGIRWMDIRRLNKFDNKGITLKRTSAVSGDFKEYVLKPNDLRYAYPLPQDVVIMSGLKQNQRE